MNPKKIFTYFFCSRDNFDYSLNPTDIERYYGEIASSDIHDRMINLHSELILETLMELDKKIESVFCNDETIIENDETTIENNETTIENDETTIDNDETIIDKVIEVNEYLEHLELFRNLVRAFYTKRPFDLSNSNLKFYDWLYVLAYKTNYIIYKMSTASTGIRDNLSFKIYCLKFKEHFSEVFKINNDILINNLPEIMLNIKNMSRVFANYDIYPLKMEIIRSKELSSDELIDIFDESGILVTSSLFRECNREIFINDNNSRVCGEQREKYINGITQFNYMAYLALIIVSIQYLGEAGIYLSILTGFYLIWKKLTNKIGK